MSQWDKEQRWNTQPVQGEHVTCDFPGYAADYSCDVPNNWQNNYAEPMYPTAPQDLAMGTDVQQSTGSTIPTVSAVMQADLEQDNAMVNFTEKSLRQGFIRKVFSILAAQLLVTFGIVTLFVTVEPVKRFVQDNPWMLIAASVTTVVIIIMLVCGEKWRRKSPHNIICLAIFTLAEAWLLGAVSGQLDVDEVMMAIGICAAVTTVMFLFGLQSKYDFTFMNGTLLVLTFCLLGFGLLCLIIQDRYLQLVYASLGALLFSMWIVIDVQMVVGMGKYAYDSEDYIMAALNIYLDVINLFLFILQLFQILSDSSD